MKLEEMDAFFTARLDTYDAHMLEDIQELPEGYRRAAACIPAQAEALLDLGCGTGLELGPIFDRLPELAVTGVDLSPAMLARLREKFPDKNVRLVCGSYVGRDFGLEEYGAALSFETLHHLAPAEKTALYRAVRRALKPGGVYVECDYMAPDEETERALFAQLAALKRAQNLPEGRYYHFDTPCTPAHQAEMLRAAGFSDIRFHWRSGDTVLLTAVKRP